MHRTHFPFDALSNWVNKWNKRETEAGQSIVVLVLGLVGLLAFAGLVFDGGTAYSQYRRMQNAADAGAMAGAQELSKKKLEIGVTDRQVYDKARYYATHLNGQPIYGGQSEPKIRVQYILPPDTLRPVPPNGAAQPPDAATGVRVTVETSFKTFFLGFVAGLAGGSVTAHSSAEYGPAIPMLVQPLAKRCVPDPVDPTDVCSLHIGRYGEIWQSEEPGNLGWLGFNGETNERNLKEEFNPDLPPKPYIDDFTTVDGVHRDPCKILSVGCWVQGTPAVKNSNDVRDALDTFWVKSSQPLVIVLYDRQFDGGANSEYHIVGFAAFMLDKYSLQDKWMYGTFVRWIDAAAVCRNCPDTGFYSVHLIPDVAEPPPGPDEKGRICTSVVYDVDVDGQFDAPQDYYLAGATVTIKDSGGATKATWVTAGLGTNCTDAVLDPGLYTVTEVNPPGYTSVPYPDGADVRSGATAVEVNGNQTTDVLFLDYWADSGTLVVLTRDGSGAVLAGLTATLALASNPGVVVGSDSSLTGTVYFRNRPGGSYIVSGSPPPGYDVTPVSAVITAGMTTTVTLVGTRYPNGDICVTAWDDENVTDGNDPISGYDKALWDAVIIVAGPDNRTHTMGQTEFTYCFVGLRAGLYRVTLQHVPGYSSVPGTTDQVTVDVADHGNYPVKFRDNIPPRGNLCVEVFDDVTGDGRPTTGEVNIAGANISVVDAGGQPVVTYTTDGTEPKCFPLLVGTYTVSETSNPPGYLSTTPDYGIQVSIFKDLAFTVMFGDRAHAPTSTPTRTRTATPTRTNTPPKGATLTPTPTPTNTPIPGVVCVLVYDDLNGDGDRDLTAPTPTGTPPATPTGTRTPIATFTPEPFLAPKNVTIVDSSSNLVESWNGTGAQPHCRSVWPDSYGATETDPLGYGSTTANNVTISVSSSVTVTAEFGDKLCFATPPIMRAPIWQSGANWLLQWNNMPGTYYTIYGSNDSNDPSVGTWTIVAEVADINYVVTKEHDGTYFYVTATDNCGTSGPSNVATIG